MIGKLYMSCPVAWAEYDEFEEHSKANQPPPKQPVDEEEEY